MFRSDRVPTHPLWCWPPGGPVAAQGKVTRAMSKIRVLLVDDHALFRAGMRLLLKTQPDMEVAAEAASAREALHQARAVAPDVVTLDLSLPGGGSLEALGQLCQECPRTHVLVLTMHDDLAYLRAALAAGAAGYLMKAAAESELLTAIRAVHQGRVFIDLHPDSSPLPPGTQALHLRPEADAPIEQLSEREREVFGLLARGHTNR